MGSEVRDTDGDLMAGRFSVSRADPIEQLGMHIAANPDKYPPVECKLRHHFAPGVYIREFTMPAGSFIIGHKHATEHLNVIIKGSAVVLMHGIITEVKAGDVIKSDAGCRKVLLVHDEMTWTTIHPTNETDLVKLERLLIDESPVIEDFTRQLEAMQNFERRLESAKVVAS